MAFAYVERGAQAIQRRDIASRLEVVAAPAGVGDDGVRRG